MRKIKNWLKRAFAPKSVITGNYLEKRARFKEITKCEN